MNVWSFEINIKGQKLISLRSSTLLKFKLAGTALIQKEFNILSIIVTERALFSQISFLVKMNAARKSSNLL